MKRIVVSSEFFNVKDTLECGQIFRFAPFSDGYKVYSGDKCAYLYNTGDTAVIECKETDGEYFSRFFDLERDYSAIEKFAESQSEEVIRRAASLGKGIRILKQDETETLFSFIVSQNNNIARITGIIERLCAALGEKKEFSGEEYHAFPSVSALANESLEFYKGMGLGYRAPYIKRLAEDIENGLSLSDFNALPTPDLKKRLVSLYGVGPKVADCAIFFGFGRSDAFPVDTWIEKVYREDFSGEIKERNRIAEYFVERFGENSGYIQQYLFYYKRTLEKSEKNKKSLRSEIISD